jgi:S-methylmethionine-dependent homocysteine/selenocysteine methylase
MTYAEEAVGVTQAAAAAGMPVAVSFTVETDNRLPSGQALRAAVEQVERATGGAPAYYMVNCAHPTHFEGALAEAGPWRDRIRGGPGAVVMASCAWPGSSSMRASGRAAARASVA